MAKKRLPGRPSKHNRNMDRQAYRLSLLGLTDEELFEILGISKPTFYLWKHQHPTFLDAILRGRDEADAMVAESMYHAILGYSHPSEQINVLKDGTVIRTPTIKHYPPDTRAGSWWLENRKYRLWMRARRKEGEGDDATITVINSPDLE